MQPTIQLLSVPVLEIALTRLLDKQGVYLFDIFNPEVRPQDVSICFHCSNLSLSSA